MMPDTGSGTISSSPFHFIEDIPRDGLGRALRDVSATAPLCVDGTGQDGMDAYAALGPEKTE
jgi:hypothetical protein